MLSSPRPIVRAGDFLYVSGIVPAAAKEAYDAPIGYFEAIPLTAYNAISTVEAEASRRPKQATQT